MDVVKIKERRNTGLKLSKFQRRHLLTNTKKPELMNYAETFHTSPM